MPTTEVREAADIFNSIVIDKLSKHDSENWESNLRNQIKAYRTAGSIRRGYRADVIFAKSDKQVIDSVKIDEIKELNIVIRNYERLKHKPIKFQLIIIKDKKSVKESEYFDCNSDMNEKWKSFVIENFTIGNYLLIDVLNSVGAIGHKSIKFY